MPAARTPQRRLFPSPTAGCATTRPSRSACRRKTLHVLVATCLIVATGIAAGCSHPIRTLIGGNMNLGGKVGVDGDLRMKGEVVTITRTDNTATPVRPVVVDGARHSGGGRIAIIDVDGLLVDRNFTGLGSMGENPVALFREKIRRVEADASIAAVVLRINTPGGGVTASDIMANDLARLKRSRNMPIVACLMTTGTGGGYYLATHADQIIAHPTSVVGGIGVILNTYNLEDTLGQYNIIPIPVKAGEKIDIGTPQRMMEVEERELLQAMADQFHDRFIDQVLAARGDRLVTSGELIATEDADAEAKVQQALFDGRVVTGLSARQLGLVDQNGYLDDAIQTAGMLAGLPDNAPVVLLRRENDRALTEFDVTPNSPMKSLIPISIPGLERSSLPTFLYLWQPEPTYATTGD